MLADLRECVEKAKQIPASDLAANIRAAFADTDPATVGPETIRGMLGMAGIQGTALPARMAEINDVLNALPAPLREKLLVEYLNELFRPSAD
jgi:hypothetical protein